MVYRNNLLISFFVCVFHITPLLSDSKREKTFYDTKIILYEVADYLGLLGETECIVNPTNRWLKFDAGIAKIISTKAGVQLKQWVSMQPLCHGIRLQEGCSFISPSFDLEKQGVKCIIHTVGPDCRMLRIDKNHSHASLIYKAWYSTLKVAHDNNIESIMIPSIATGIFNCPKTVAAQAARQAIQDFFSTYEFNTSLKKIVIAVPHNVWESYADEIMPELVYITGIGRIRRKDMWKIHDWRTGRSNLQIWHDLWEINPPEIIWKNQAGPK